MTVYDQIEKVSDADSFLIFADEQTALFGGGYNENGIYRTVKLVGYGSYGAFVDNNARMFIKRFISI